MERLSIVCFFYKGVILNLKRLNRNKSPERTQTNNLHHFRLHWGFGNTCRANATISTSSVVTSGRSLFLNKIVHNGGDQG